MNSVYGNVMAFILLFPWTFLAVTIVGWLRARWIRRQGSAGYSGGLGYTRLTSAPPPGR
jgi:hypothetical protein